MGELRVYTDGKRNGLDIQPRVRTRLRVKVRATTSVKSVEVNDASGEVKESTTAALWSCGAADGIHLHEQGDPHLPKKAQAVSKLPLWAMGCGIG